MTTRAASTCNQGDCNNPGAFRFTWPGRDEAYVCEEHAPKLVAVAEAMGLNLRLVRQFEDNDLEREELARRVLSAVGSYNLGIKSVDYYRKTYVDGRPIAAVWVDVADELQQIAAAKVADELLSAPNAPTSPPARVRLVDDDEDLYVGKRREP